MNAPLAMALGPCPHRDAVLRPMTADDVDEVVQVETDLYPFPWTRGNFLDSLAAGYPAHILTRDRAPIAYAVLMRIPDEMHLLNLSVSANSQRQGLGRWLLARLMDDARAEGMQSMLLEVRPSNKAGQGLYRAMGFAPIGLRRRYYPSFNQSREDAIVMRCSFNA